MEEKLVLALVVVCMLAIAHAQYTAIDQEWLMDDPHKAGIINFYIHVNHINIHMSYLK
jgi:hypothetical protein